MQQRSGSKNYPVTVCNYATIYARKPMNNPSTPSVCGGGNFREVSTIYSIHAVGGPHDMPAAEGLGRSAERDSIPHCSSLFATCFSFSSPCSLSEQDRTKSPSHPLTLRLPKFFNRRQATSHRKLPASHLGGAKMSKAFCAVLPRSLLFRTKLGTLSFLCLQKKKKATGVRDK